jgi:hypothetical protein
MQSSNVWIARVPWGAWLVLGAVTMRGATGCGTQPCFRHSDCASSEVCSNGACVLAPVDVVLPVNDGGATDTGTPPVVDTGTPVVDSNGPGTANTPDAYEAATAVGDAGVDGDAGDSAGE